MAMVPKTMDDFLMNKFKEYLKVYLVLRQKGFSWKKELQNSFSIADSIVNESLKVLEREGFVISKDFWSLELDLQEIIRRTNGAYFDKINSFPKVYILNNDEVRTSWYDANKHDIEKLIKGDGSMMHTLGLAKEHKKSYDKLKKHFDFLEANLNERKRVDIETGITYITSTKKALLLKQEIAKALMESKYYIMKKKDAKLIGKNKSGGSITISTNNIKEITENDENSGYKRKYFVGNKNVSKPEYDMKEREIENIEKEDSVYEKEMDETEKIKKKIHLFREKGEDVPHLQGIGIMPEDINKKIISRLDNWEFLLGLKNEIKSINSNKETELDLKINKLLSILKDKTFLDVFTALDVLGSHANLKIFQEKIKDMNVTFDGDDFILR